jgi:8-oxo-dGTP diphosphatase
MPLGKKSEKPGKVRAGGGIVARAVHGGFQVAIVHRPRYDDWSFPKGKAKPDESELNCALREVEEETGLSCDAGPELSSTTYSDRFDRIKTVRYWAMRPHSGQFEPGDETDELRWLSPSEATSLLSYERDRNLLASAERTLSVLMTSNPSEPESLD